MPEENGVISLRYTRKENVNKKFISSKFTQIVINMQELGEYCSHGSLLKCLLEIKSTTKIRETLTPELVVNMKYMVLVELRLNEVRRGSL